MALPPPAVFGLAGERLAPVVDADRRIVLGQHVTAVHDHAHRPDGAGRLRVRAQQLAAGDPDAVVRRRHVQYVGRVDDDHHVAAGQRVGVRTRQRLGPPLRIGEKDLHTVGVHLRRPGERSALDQRVVLGQAATHVYADRVSAHAGRP
jgi:hypothetical protein